LLENNKTNYESSDEEEMEK
jgi:hypothetical protein